MISHSMRKRSEQATELKTQLMCKTLTRVQLKITFSITIIK